MAWGALRGQFASMWVLMAAEAFTSDAFEWCRSQYRPRYFWLMALHAVRGLMFSGERELGIRVVGKLQIRSLPARSAVTLLTVGSKLPIVEVRMAIRAGGEFQSDVIDSFRHAFDFRRMLGFMAGVARDCCVFAGKFVRSKVVIEFFWPEQDD